MLFVLPPAAAGDKTLVKQHSVLCTLAIYCTYVYVCDCICMQFMLVLGYLAKGDLKTHLVQLNRE